MTPRQWTCLGAAVSGAALAIIGAAPFMAPHGTFTGLDGNPGYIDNGWLGHGPAGLAYLLGDVFCHQEEARSLVLNGSQMPFCIRDTGILAGLVAGFLLCLPLGERVRDIRWALVGLALLAVTVAEWVAEHWTGDMPTARLVSGVAAGAGAALVLCWWVRREQKV